jgi:hypothetical protein
LLFQPFLVTFVDIFDLSSGERGREEEEVGEREKERERERERERRE